MPKKTIKFCDVRDAIYPPGVEPLDPSLVDAVLAVADDACRSLIVGQDDLIAVTSTTPDDQILGEVYLPCKNGRTLVFRTIFPGERETDSDPGVSTAAQALLAEIATYVLAQSMSAEYGRLVPPVMLTALDIGNGPVIGTVRPSIFDHHEEVNWTEERLELARQDEHRIGVFNSLTMPCRQSWRDLAYSLDGRQAIRSGRLNFMPVGSPSRWTYHGDPMLNSEDVAAIKRAQACAKNVLPGIIGQDVAAEVTRRAQMLRVRKIIVPGSGE